jgi:hypothetical protein
MTDSFPKYILVFLALIYLVACVAEIWAVKGGAAAVFESVEKVVPHLAMLVIGYLFSRK